MAIGPAPRRALAAALWLLGFALYAPTFGFPFAYDDFANLVRNPSVRWRELSLANLFEATFGPSNRRPIAFYSFALNYYFGGYEPIGYRIVNAAIHASNGVLVFALALRCIPWLRPRNPAPTAAARDPAPWLAALAALLFLLHPLQTNSVTYVVQRMNSLAAGFQLAALLLFLRARDAQSRRARRWAAAGAAACFALACGSKQTGVTLPFAVALLEWLRRGLRGGLPRRALRWLAAYSALLAAAGVYALWGPAFGYARRDFGMGERLLTQARVVTRYLALVFWPHPSRLNLLHDVETSHSLLDPPSTLACLLFLGLLAAAAFALRTRLPWLAFAAFWFFLQLAVESSLLPLEMIYEHRTYLPLVGICIAAPVALQQLCGGRRVAVAACGAALALPLGLWTLERNQVWSSSERLWRDVIAKSPRDPRGYSNLGSTLQEADQHRAALLWFERALEVDPDFDDAWRGLGASLMALDRPAEALPDYERAVALDPLDYQAWGGLGAVLAMLGRVDEAEVAHRRSIAIFPDERVVTNYGRVLALQGRNDAAIEMYRNALRLDPDLASASMQLGLLYEDLGRPAEALRELEHAVRLTGDPEARLSLATALWGVGRARDAIATLRELVAAHPQWATPANNLAWMLATCADPSLRDPAQALALAEAQQRAGSGDLDTLAAAHAAAGHFREAIAAVDAALVAVRAAGDAALEAEILARRAHYAAREPYLDPASRARDSAAPAIGAPAPR